MFPEGYDILTQQRRRISLLRPYEMGTYGNARFQTAARRASETAARDSGAIRINRLVCGRNGKSSRENSRLNYRQYEIPVKGQCDILISGIPDISPYNVYSALHPILVQ
jgi:hypothetical protein